MVTLGDHPAFAAKADWNVIELPTFRRSVVVRFPTPEVW